MFPFGAFVLGAMVVMLVVFVAVVGLGLRPGRSRSGRPSLWRSAARRLGLRFSPPTSTSPVRIEGKIRGLRVEASALHPSSGRSRQKPVIRFRIRFDPPLSVQLALFREGQHRKLEEKHGLTDTIIGDERFDRLFVVVCRNREALLDYLDEPRRKHLVTFFEKYTSARVSHEGIYWETGAPLRSAHQLITITRDLVHLGLALRESSSTSKAGSRSPETSSPASSSEAEPDLLPSPEEVAPADVTPEVLSELAAAPIAGAVVEATLAPPAPTIEDPRFDLAPPSPTSSRDRALTLEELLATGFDSPSGGSPDIEEALAGLDWPDLGLDAGDELSRRAGDDLEAELDALLVSSPGVLGFGLEEIPALELMPEVDTSSSPAPAGIDISDISGAPTAAPRALPPVALPDDVDDSRPAPLDLESSRKLLLELLGPGSSGLGAISSFEEEHQGREITFEGTLESLEEDFTGGSTAVLRVELPGMSDRVSAYVLNDREEEARLRRHLGKSFRGRGTLVKLDVYTNRLWLLSPSRAGSIVS